VHESLWRAVAVFRVGALCYAGVLIAGNFDEYPHPVAGWLVLAVMAGWTAASIYGYAAPQRRGWPLLVADLAVTAGCLLASRWVIGPAGLTEGLATLPVAWIAGPVLAWAVSGGRRRGIVAALVIGATDLVVRAQYNQSAFTGAVLLLLAGVAVGHVARLAVDAERRLQEAAEREAVTRERERLSRGLHDSVLQVLALVQRRGLELGGPAADLGRLAGEQEAALRALISTGSPATAAVDLRTLLGRYASTAVSVATPAHPVVLPATAAESVVAAVGAALDNVRRHCGPDARAWLLVEDEPEAVTVTVRDEGPGFPADRLAQAAGEGRLGVAQSIRGRLRDLGGTATITSDPGSGTEVELRVPRPAQRASIR